MISEVGASILPLGSRPFAYSRLSLWTLAPFERSMARSKSEAKIIAGLIIAAASIAAFILTESGKPSLQ